jgi:hypothetical protein
MNGFSRDLVQSMLDAAAFAGGRERNARIRVAERAPEAMSTFWREWPNLQSQTKGCGAWHHLLARVSHPRRDRRGNVSGAYVGTTGLTVAAMLHVVGKAGGKASGRCLATNA